MMTEDQQKAYAEDRWMAALWYAWGREDQGDRRLRDGITDRVGALAFADWAKGEAASFAAGEGPCMLTSVQTQYDRFLAESASKEVVK